MSTLLALDPGGTTGWSLWELPETEPLRHLQHGMVKGGLGGFLHWWLPDGIVPDIVVAEDFILDGRTLTPDTTPLEILGALQAIRPDLIRQRNTAKALVPDSLLSAHGWKWKGAGHDRDSARHAIAYARTIRHMPTLRAFWPPKRREN